MTYFNAAEFREKKTALDEGVTFKAQIVPAKVGYRWNKSKYDDSVVLVTGATEKNGYRSQKFSFIGPDGKPKSMSKGYFHEVEDTEPLEWKIDTSDQEPPAPVYDYMGSQLVVGDLIFYHMSGNYSYSAIARVIGFSKQGARVMQIDSKKTNWYKGGASGAIVVITASDRIIVVNGLASAEAVATKYEIQAEINMAAHIKAVEDAKAQTAVDKLAEVAKAEASKKRAAKKEAKRLATIAALTEDQKMALGL